MINMLNKLSNIYVILIIIAVVIYIFFLKEHIYESFFKGRRNIGKIVSESCKLETNKTRRRIREANLELENARYKMESAFRSCNRML